MMLLACMLILRPVQAVISAVVAVASIFRYSKTMHSEIVIANQLESMPCLNRSATRFRGIRETTTILSTTIAYALSEEVVVNPCTAAARGPDLNPDSE